MTDTNRRVEIVLVSPPLQWEEKLRLSFQPPLNLLYLRAYLRARHVDTVLLDVVATQCSLDDAVARVAAFAPATIGLPLYYASLPNAVALATRLKERLPGLRTIAGGPCMTMEPERMMREGGFDFGVIGEGEETLAELLAALRAAVTGSDSQAGAMAGIAGLAWRRDGAIVVNARRAPIPALDPLPYLDFTGLDNDYYFRAQDQANVPRTLFLNSSRGCSFRCTYCCTPVLWPGPIRRYSPRRLVDEIRHQLAQFPGVEIGFCDDSFFADRRWLLEFLDLVEPLGMQFQCIGRADHLTPDLIARLVGAGMNYIAFGVETGTARRQASLRKHLDLGALVAVMRELTKYSVKTKCFFMLGFPDETLDEMADTINLAVALREAGMTFFSIFPVTVYPGTELARQFAQVPFNCGIDAHLPEIIRDGLGIGDQAAAALEAPFNALLTQRQMVNAVTFAYDCVSKGRRVSGGDLKRALQ